MACLKGSLNGAETTRIVNPITTYIEQEQTIVC